jgi:hypothetical protein
MRYPHLAPALSILPLLASASLEAQATLTLRPLGTYVSGLADPTQDITSAETAALRGGLMYVTNATDVSLDIVSVADPRQPVRLRRVDLRAYGASVTSVAVSRNNLIAVAVDASPKTDPGSVVFLTPGGQVIRSVQVGAGPDMVVFTPDGRRLLVANEGEPDCYGPGCTDPEGSVSVVEVIPRRNRLTVHTIGFGGLAMPAGVRIFGPGASVAQDLEPEYVTVSDDSRTAWVTLQENNAIAEIDLDALAVTGIFPLGSKDHSLPGQGLDPSDRDAAVQIRPWANVRGLYQPDAIASFEAGGRAYLVTANEGDARDYAGFAEEARARSVAAFIGIPGVSDNALLGRLTVTTSPPGGDFANLYAFGARSFSIWDAASGALVWDSGDQLEQVTAAAFPAHFNSNNTSNGFDDRSDNKGPEPEGVAVGRVGGRTYAFVGLERIGGVVVYDVTTPTAPLFQQYFSTRDFTAATPGPDLGPEIVRFVPAQQSPTGMPLLLIANEVSGTVNLVALSAD